MSRHLFKFPKNRLCRLQQQQWRLTDDDNESSRTRARSRSRLRPTKMIKSNARRVEGGKIFPAASQIRETTQTHTNLNGITMTTTKKLSFSTVFRLFNCRRRRRLICETRTDNSLPSEIRNWFKVVLRQTSTTTREGKN